MNVATFVNEFPSSMDNPARSGARIVRRRRFYPLLHHNTKAAPWDTFPTRRPLSCPTGQITKDSRVW